MSSDEELDDKISELVSRQHYTPSVDALTVALMAEFGGPGGLAACIKEDYQEAKDKGASNTCALITRSVIDLLKITAEKHKNDEQEDKIDPALAKAVLKRLNIGQEKQ